MSIPLRLLLIEDSERDAVLLVRMLQRGGYDVAFERVVSAEAMTAALDRGDWDLLIGDYSMPHFSAPAALGILQERHVDLPVIIVSGTMSQEVAVRTIRAGARDFLAKSDLSRLLPTVERELREVSERRALHAAEDALRSNEQSLRLLFATSLQPMWIFDLHTLAFLEVNDAALAEYSYSRDEFLQLRVTAILPPIIVHQLFAYHPPPGSSPHLASIWELRTRNGQIVNVPVAIHPVQFAGHDARLVVALEINPRKQEQATRILTTREHEVLAWLVRGVTSNRELATQLGVSVNTVKYHLRNILAKLQLQNRAQVVAYALRQDRTGTNR